MFNVISSDFETPTEDAVVTVSTNLSDAVQWIDEQFGGGFARQHPTLTGLFTLACAIDCAGVSLALSTRGGLKDVASAINNVDFPDVKEEIKSLADATESIASAIEYK